MIDFEKPIRIRIGNTWQDAIAIRFLQRYPNRPVWLVAWKGTDGAMVASEVGDHAAGAVENVEGEAK